MQVNVGLDWLLADARNVSEQPDRGWDRGRKESDSRNSKEWTGMLAPEREGGLQGDKKE